MKNWAFLLACVSPFIGLVLLGVAMVANWHFVLIAMLAGYTAAGLLTPGYYRGLADIYRHGIHNDR